MFRDYRDDNSTAGESVRTTLSRVRSLVTAFVTTAAVVVVTTVAVVFGAAAPASAGIFGATLHRGDRLGPGDYIQMTYCGGCLPSARTYWLIMQSDDNLVEYKQDANGTKVCFASNTVDGGWNSVYVVYQSDGNFVMYDYLGYVYWASNSVGDSGTTVSLEQHGELYVGYKLMNAAWLTNGQC